MTPKRRARRCPRGVPLALQVDVLRAMPDVDAVVHTHSRHAAAFAVARRDLPFICNESIVTRADHGPPPAPRLRRPARRAGMPLAVPHGKLRGDPAGKA